MTNDSLKEIREGLSKLPAGPWHYVPAHVAEGDAEVRVAEGWLLCTLPSDEWASQVARFPNTIRALLDHLDAAKAEADKLIDDLNARVVMHHAAEAERDAARALLRDVLHQFESDLKSAHAEICKLQGLDPATHTWPEWSPQANSLRWIDKIRRTYAPEAAA